MTKVEINLELDLSKYDYSVDSKIRTYLQNMDMYLGMSGIAVDFNSYECEVL